MTEHQPPSQDPPANRGGPPAAVPRRNDGGAGAPPEPFTGLSATGLSRSFGAVHAVVRMDLHAPAGQVTALIGPNGSGKTTLLLMLASLLAPDTGSISVMGVDPVKNPAAARAKIGWMPDTLGVWEALTAREILSTLARFYHLPKAAIPGRVTELLERVKLTDLADQKARVLSRGQQQRLSLARALIHDPEVLLLDEPASGLDPGSRIALRGILRELAAEGKAIVVSSHVLAELDEIADGAVFVNKGQSVLTQSVAQAVGQSRKYSIAALDAADLASGLAALRVPYTEGVGRGPSVNVNVGSTLEASKLLRELITAGVAVHDFGPAAGALEETYMSMESEQP
ncbi:MULTISPECIES: ABC transporter ATP-binding protein [Arthrobacter]|uniref:ABC transporter ATP-binding protein n=1 Tax=Arthrobacter TaxID=1663 RepID=UPI0009E70019|nr:MULTISPECIES: ABC transporter ATP-binding protein [Arthrobacter]